MNFFKCYLSKLSFLFVFIFNCLDLSATITFDYTDSVVKSFNLPNNTFESGKYDNFNKKKVDSVILEITNFLKKIPKNQKIIIEIESSESSVPTNSLGLLPGKLSELRSNEMKKYIETFLPKNIKINEKVLGVQGPYWDTIKGKDHLDYKKWQYVSFNVVVFGKNEIKNCDDWFYIIIDYKKEWCTLENKSLCHKCDFALFFVWANGVPLIDNFGSKYINLNNFSLDTSSSGGSRSVKLVISDSLRNEIIKKDSTKIIITYNCAIPECHSEPIHITIFNSKDEILLPGTFFSNQGNKLTKKGNPVKLIELNKCGEVIQIFKNNSNLRDQKNTQKEPKPFNLQFDDKNNFTSESIYEIYKFVDSNGILKIPESEIKIFRLYKKYQNKSWEEIVDDLGFTNKEINNFKKYLKQKTLKY